MHAHMYIPAVEETTAALGVPAGLLCNLSLQLTHLIPHLTWSLTELSGKCTCNKHNVQHVSTHVDMWSVPVHLHVHVHAPTCTCIHVHVYLKETLLLGCYFIIQ